MNGKLANGQDLLTILLGSLAEKERARVINRNKENLGYFS